MSALFLLLGLAVGYWAGMVEGEYRSTRKVARLITELTPKDDDR